MRVESESLKITDITSTLRVACRNVHGSATDKVGFRFWLLDDKGISTREINQSRSR